MKIELSYVTWIHGYMLFVLKLKIFIKTLQLMLKNSSIHSIMMEMIQDLFQSVKIKIIPALFKDGFNGKIVKELVASRAKTYGYLMEDNSEHKKAKGTKKCLIKRELMFENYKSCVLNNKTVLKKQQPFKSDH